MRPQRRWMLTALKQSHARRLVLPWAERRTPALMLRGALPDTPRRAVTV